MQKIAQKNSTNLFALFLLLAPISISGCSQSNFAASSTKKPTVTTGTKNDSQATETPTNELPSAPIQTDDGDSSTIPGVEAQRIGVHFEDGKDNDFNDVSVCFDAPFKVAARPGLPPQVVMAQPHGQKVKVYLTSLTGNVPTVTIKIIDSAGKVLFQKAKSYTRSANSNTENPVGPFFEEFFPFGSKMYVQFNWGGAQLNTDGPGKVRVESNVCRNTGN